jgi:hypothetical protein
LAKNEAKRRVLKTSACRRFVEGLLGRLYGRGMSAESFAARITQERVTVSNTPNPDSPMAGATTDPGTFHVTFYLPGYAPGVDVAEEMIHEAFHVGPNGRSDIAVEKALDPTIRLHGDPQTRMDIASALWDPSLMKYCGSGAPK